MRVTSLGERSERQAESQPQESEFASEYLTNCADRTTPFAPEHARHSASSAYFLAQNDSCTGINHTQSGEPPMKSVAITGALFLLLADSAYATLVTIEPDDFAPGQ